MSTVTKKRASASKTTPAATEATPAPATADAPTTPQIVELDARQLDPHPLNPRDAITDAAIEPLRNAIAAQGQLQPCLVRPHPDGQADHYEILIGHRRALACEHLFRPVRCVVENLDDDQAILAMFADNDHHEKPDPFREAAVVEHLLARPGWTQRAIADALGRPVSWVARRAELAKVPEVLRKAHADPEHPISAWPVTWVEQLALIDAERLAEMVAKDEEQVDVHGNRYDSPFDVHDLKSLRALVAHETHLLHIAPWDLHDEQLVPIAGSCVACPKTSGRAPGLFDDLELEDDPGKRAGSRCRDGACWEDKARAYAKAELTRLRRENNDAIVVRAGGGGNPLLQHNDITGKQVVNSWEVRILERDEPKAQRAIICDGIPRLGWVSMPSRTIGDRGAGGGAKGAAKPKEKGKAETIKELRARLAASRDALERRRMAHVIDGVRADVEATSIAPAGLVCTGITDLHGLIVLYGCRAASGMYGSEQRVSGVGRAIQQKASGGDSGAMEMLWPLLRPLLIDALKRVDPRSLKSDFAEARMISWTLEGRVRWSFLEQAAREAIPNPKWWAAADARIAEADAKPKPARGGVRKRSEPGTEDEAAAGPAAPAAKAKARRRKAAS